MVILSTDAIAMKLSTQIRTWKTKPNSHQLNKYINPNMGVKQTVEFLFEQNIVTRLDF